MSIVTYEMIEQWAAFYGISIEDGTQIPGIVGSLNALAEGRGELPAKLMNGNKVFYPLMEAYWTANGGTLDSFPETWKQPLVDVEKTISEDSAE